MSELREKLVLAFVVALVGLSPVVGVVGTAAAAPSSPPAGMTALADANVQDIRPDGVSTNVTESDLQGAIYVSRHASTTEVSIVTDNQAEKVGNGSSPSDVAKQAVCSSPAAGKNPNFNCDHGSSLALVVSDDQNHEGREIAVRTSVLKEALGYVPNYLTVKNNETGQQWQYAATVEDGWLTATAEHFSSNSVTWESSVSITSTGAANGTQFQYHISELDAASDPTVNLTGVATTQNDTVTGSATSGTIAADISGTETPPSTTLTLFGNGFGSRWDNQSHAGVGDGHSGSITVDGSLSDTSEASAPTVTVTGNTTTQSKSSSWSGVSNGASKTVSVGGNAPPSGQSVTFTGEESTFAESRSGTGVSGGSSTSISVGGDESPRNAQITFIGGASPSPHSIVSDQGDGATESSQNMVGDSGNNDLMKSAVQFTPSAGEKIKNLTVDIASVSGSDTGTGISVYLVPGTIDSTYREGTKIATWDPTWSTGEQTISVSGADVTGGQTYHLEFVTESTDSDGSTDMLTLKTDDSGNDKSGYSAGGSTYNIYGWGDVRMAFSATQNPSVDVDGDGTADASYSGTLSNGETMTKSVSSLSTGSVTLDFGGSGAPYDWSLSYDRVEHTEDPSVDADGDGTADATYSGTLAPGQTATVSISALSTGSNTLSVSTASSTTTGLSASWTERTQTDNPSVTLDSVTESHTGKLADGETVTLSWAPSDLTAGASNSYSISLASVSTGSPAMTADYSLSINEVDAAKNPSVDIDNDGIPEASVTGLMTGTDSQNFSISPSLSDDSWAVSSTGSPVTIEAVITETTVTGSAGVELNNVSNSTSGLAEGDTQTLTLPQSAIVEGTNVLNISAGDGSLSGDAPAPKVALNYSHDALDRQSVQYESGRWVESYNVSKSFASSRENVWMNTTFEHNVVSIRSVEMRVDGGSWSTVADSNYQLEQNDVAVDVDEAYGGDIPENTTVDVRFVGGRVDPVGMEVTILEASAPNEDLNSKIRVDSQTDDSYIDVGPTAQGDRIHYTHEESWDANSFVLVDSGGSQELHVPGARADDTFRVSTVATRANLSTGDAKIRVIETGSTPQFKIGPGPSGPGDQISLTHYQTSSGTTYLLKEILPESTSLIDSAVANSPVTLTVEDKDWKVGIFVGDGSGTKGDPEQQDTEQTGQGGVTLGSSLFIVLSVVLLAGVWFVSQKFGRGRISTERFALGAVVVIGIFGLEIISAASLVAGIANGIATFLGGAASSWPLLILAGAAIIYYWLRQRGKPNNVVKFEIPGRGEN
ncbi:hypothetical protein [Halolamina salifodinae]|uniref:Uncharacterized protein n=1 Tax=Halolamina salifodinae TaxID=1202767 RepID=A0A8T4GSC2_9EURY|nr:hypothetical protein [Halolamina salifodinae]MBP1985937.1 hypothetical protein [Halolamina salifodinae]